MTEDGIGKIKPTDLPPGDQQMTQSEDEKDDRGAKGFESKLTNGYDFERDHHGIDVWGDIEVNGKWLNYYKSPEIIYNEFTRHLLQEVDNKPDLKEGVKIIDIGGGDGYLLNKVLEQMEAAGVKNIEGLNLDADPSGKALPAMEAKIESGEYSHSIRPVKADVIAGIPLEPESIDMAISRFAIQYSLRDDHLTFLKNTARVLKTGGIFVLEFPSHGGRDHETYNTVMRQISMIVNDGEEFKRDFPDPEVFFHGDPEDADFTAQTGLRVRLGGVRTEMPFSADAWGDRFALDEWKIESIRTLYANVQHEFPDLIEIVNGVPCLKNYIFQYKFEKIATVLEPETEENV